MFTIGTVVIVGFVALLVGGAIGYWLGPMLGSRSPQQKELEEKLAEAEQRFSHYRNQVNRHFEETARRVNTLTKDYKEVHEHLVNSAIQLADPAAGDQFVDTARRHLPGSEGSERSEGRNQGDSDRGDVIDHGADSREMDHRATEGAGTTESPGHWDTAGPAGQAAPDGDGGDETGDGKTGTQ